MYDAPSRLRRRKELLVAKTLQRVTAKDLLTWEETSFGQTQENSHRDELAVVGHQALGKHAWKQNDNI